MSYLSTACGECPNCGRILFTTRDGLWPAHVNTSLRLRPWCVGSDTQAPEVRLRAVLA